MLLSAPFLLTAAVGAQVCDVHLDQLFHNGFEPAATMPAPAGGGLPGGAVVIDPYPGSSSAFFGPLVPVRDFVGFWADDGASPPDFWISRGTAATTLRVHQASGNLSAREAARFRGSVVFNGMSASAGSELWVSDGSIGGTRMLAELRPGTSSSTPQAMQVVGNQLLFVAQTGASTVQLFALDDLAATPRVVATLPVSAISDVNGDFSAAGRWWATVGFSPRRLWTSDGTTAGTRAIDSVNFTANGIGTAGGKAVFFFNDGIHGEEPWVSDGTPAGTRLLRDVWPGPTGSTRFLNNNPNTRAILAAPLGPVLLFAANDNAGGYELWRTDGTPAGTTRVVDHRPGPFPGVGIRVTIGGRAFGELGGRAFFQDMDNDDGIGTGGLWTTDGTAAGTLRFATPSVPSLVVSGPGAFTTVGGYLFFSAYNDTVGQELFVTDGIVVPQPVVNHADGGASTSFSGAPQAAGTNLFFVARPSVGAAQENRLLATPLPEPVCPE